MGPPMKYDRILAWCAVQSWALMPEILGVLVDVLTYRAAGHRLDSTELEAILQAARANHPLSAAANVREKRGGGQVAVIPIHGIISPRASNLSATSQAGTGIDELTQTFRRAMSDPNVASVLFDIDSPGGAVGGVQELAAEIRSLRGIKPIAAIANGMAASAAFWLGSQVDEFAATPSGEVGGIGVYTAHTERTKQLENEGLKTTLISAGKFKIEGNPFEPLTDEAKAHLQERVNTAFATFTKDVAKGRAVKLSEVLNGFGQGRTLAAPAALAEGMIDRVATFDEMLGRLMRGKVEATGARADGYRFEPYVEQYPVGFEHIFDGGRTTAETDNKEGPVPRAPNWQTTPHRMTFAN